MHFDFSSAESLYLQVANQIEEAIFSGAFAEGTQIPSTTEISRQFKINPATVLKGMNILVEQQLIEKKRGLGMFVMAGAQTKIIAKRKASFFEDYVASLIVESKKLGLSKADLQRLIERGYGHE
ncbi:GntR family transcriptional regulator [Lapidilactobacillus bayanensis]|uniref:GntR family transcriptional regulator n=1 Tax=Lapidilactobacillus bayanensis TaxID=2485998 RepID=UPI000F76F7AF|nr:GntR family transcriptional regulator [Lapidilactobacillus bayanensis]